MSENPKEPSKKVALALLVLIIILSELIIFIYANQKYGFHIDELWSYAHSNSSEGGFLYPVEFSGELYDHNDVVYNHWVEPIKFWNYLTVQEDEAFKYANVLSNLSEGVHPPLYYLLFHTLDSFFPETFSKWLGIVPNMVLFGFVLIGTYQLSRLLIGSRAKSLIVCAVFGFSIAAVNMTIFIRSYLLLTSITLLFVLEMSKLLLDFQLMTFRLIKLFLLLILGVLTHYYFIIFIAFFLSLVGYYLLIGKHKKLLYRLAEILLTSILSAVLLSPTILTHFFSSTRGHQASLRGFLGLIVLAYISALVLLILRIIRKKKNQELPNLRIALAKVHSTFQMKLLQSSPIDLVCKLLFFSTLLTVAVLIIVAPNMGIHSNRYYFYLMPFLFILGIREIFLRLGRSPKGVEAAPLIGSLLVVLTLSSHLVLHSSYGFPDTENRSRLNGDVQDSICLLVSAQDYLVHNFSDVFYNADKVFVAREISNPSIQEAFSGLGDAQRIMVIIDSRIPETTEETILLEDQIGHPLQYQYEARHGTFFYRIYTLDNQP